MLHHCITLRWEFTNTVVARRASCIARDLGALLIFPRKRTLAWRKANPDMALGSMAALAAMLESITSITLEKGMLMCVGHILLGDAWTYLNNLNERTDNLKQPVLEAAGQIDYLQGEN